MIKTAVRHMETAVLPQPSITLPHLMPGFVAPAIKAPAVKLTAVEARAPLPRKRKALPAVWMRAGTSKGLYLHRQDLPSSQKDWPGVITRVMGSYDGDAKQLNGIGGATSTTSKVAVVSPSQRPGVDVDYTFVQVPLGGSTLDMTGNCGNIASGVGPFAVDEGLVPLKPGQSEVKVSVFNTNTQSIMEETVQIDDEGHFLEDGDCTLPGLCSMGSRVQMSFVRPAGALTGKLLPTGRAADTLLIQTAPSCAPTPVQVSMVDAANPFVLVDADSLPSFFHEQGPGAPESIAFIELVRREGAVAMGLASSAEEAARTRGTPKIAVLSTPKPTGASTPDVQCVAYSMGKVHGSLQLTGAVCLSIATCTPGTVAHAIKSRRIPAAVLSADLRSKSRLEQVKLRHTGGNMEVDVRLNASGGAEDVSVSRTARRLFEGKVFYLQ